MNRVSSPRRQADLQQLQRLWLQAQAGDPKVVAILGDLGSGKSTLLRDFMAQQVAQLPLPQAESDPNAAPVAASTHSPALTPLVLWLTPDLHQSSPLALVLNILDCLAEFSTERLSRGYTELLPWMKSLDLTWGHAEFRIALLEALKLPENPLPGEKSEQDLFDRLMKVIRVDVPVVKKLTFSIKQPQTQLADGMLDPWLLVAAGLTGELNSLPEPLKALMEHAQRFRSQYGKQDPQSSDDNVPAIQASETWVTTLIGILDWIEKTLCHTTDALQHRERVKTREASQAAAPRRAHNQRSTASLVPPALVLMLDQWEEISHLGSEGRRQWKACLCQLLTGLQEAPPETGNRASSHDLNRESGQRKRALLWVMTCRSASLGKALGAEPADFESELAKNNLPKTLFKSLAHKILLGPDAPDEETETSSLTQEWARFQLAAGAHFCQSLLLLQQILQQPCTHGVQGFTVARLIGALELTDAPQTVFNLLHQLFNLGWIQPVPVLPSSVLAQKQQADGPYYIFKGGLLQEFLTQQIPLWLAREQTHATEAIRTLSLEAIPLALEAAELSPLTTQSLLDHQASPAMLEKLFSDAYTLYEHVLQKLNVLENWAVLPPAPVFLEILGDALGNPLFPLLREYAARHLGRVFLQVQEQVADRCIARNDPISVLTFTLKPALETALNQLTERLTGPQFEDLEDSRICKAAALKAALPLFPQKCRATFQLLLADPNPRVRRLAFEGVLNGESCENTFIWIQQGLADEVPFVAEAVLETLIQRLGALNHSRPPHALTSEYDWHQGWLSTLQLPSLQAALAVTLERALQNRPLPNGEKPWSAFAVEAAAYLLLATGMEDISTFQDRLGQVFTACRTPGLKATVALKQLRAMVQAMVYTMTQPVPLNRVALATLPPLFQTTFETQMQWVLQDLNEATLPAVEAHVLWGMLTQWERVLVFSSSTGEQQTASFEERPLRRVTPELVRQLSALSNGQLASISPELKPVLALAAARVLKRLLGTFLNSPVAPPSAIVEKIPEALPGKEQKTLMNA